MSIIGKSLQMHLGDKVIFTLRMTKVEQSFHSTLNVFDNQYSIFFHWSLNVY